MDAASPAREMVRTKKEARGSSRTAKARKGMVEATEDVSGSEAISPPIPNAMSKILATQPQTLPSTPCICGILETRGGSTMPTA